MIAVTKNIKTNKINLFLQKHLVYLAENLHGILVGPWFSELSKWKKKSVADLDHSDILLFMGPVLPKCQYLNKC